MDMLDGNRAMALCVGSGLPLMSIGLSEEQRRNFLYYGSLC